MDKILTILKEQCWYKIGLQMLLAVIVIKMVDFLLVQPLRNKWYYEKQGVNCTLWHPFHLIGLIRRGVKCNRFLLPFKELIMNDPNAKAYFFYWGTSPTLILNQPEQIKDLTQTKESQFQRNPYRSKSVALCVGRQNIIHGDYAQWKSSRKLFSAFFGFQNIKTMVPDVISIAKSRMLPLHKNDQIVSIIDTIGMITGQVIFSLFCGTNQDGLYDQEGNHLAMKLQDTVGRFNEGARFGLDSLFFGDWLKKAGVFKKDREIMRDIKDVRSRLEKAMVDVISRLDSDPNSGNEFMRKAKPQLVELMQDKERLVSEFMVIFNAGTDTTSHVIQQVLINLHLYPECKDKLLKELDNIPDSWDFTYEQVTSLKYLECVIKESLRLECPAPGINPREQKDKSHENQVGDLSIRRDTQCGLIFMTTLLNPRYFPDPLLFNPERWADPSTKNNDPFIFTPFSMGTRSCIGERMSLLEQKIILTLFLKNFDYHITTDIDKIKWVMRTVYQPKDSVFMKISPKNSK